MKNIIIIGFLTVSFISSSLLEVIQFGGKGKVEEATELRGSTDMESQDTTIEAAIIELIQYLKDHEVRIDFIESYHEMDQKLFRHERVFLKLGKDYFDQPLEVVVIHHNYTEEYTKRLLEDAQWYIENRIKAIRRKKENREINFIKAYLGE